MKKLIANYWLLLKIYQTIFKLKKQNVFIALKFLKTKCSQEIGEKS